MSSSSMSSQSPAANFEHSFPPLRPQHPSAAPDVPELAGPSQQPKSTTSKFGGLLNAVFGGISSSSAPASNGIEPASTPSLDEARRMQAQAERRHTIEEQYLVAVQQATEAAEQPVTGPIQQRRSPRSPRKRSATRVSPRDTAAIAMEGPGSPNSRPSNQQAQPRPRYCITIVAAVIAVAVVAIALIIWQTAGSKGSGPAGTNGGGPTQGDTWPGQVRIVSRRRYDSWDSVLTNVGATGRVPAPATAVRVLHSQQPDRQGANVVAAANPNNDDLRPSEHLGRVQAHNGRQHHRDHAGAE